MISLLPDQQKLFDAVCTRFNLTDKQQNQVLTYIDLLLTYNEKFNLTAVTKLDEVLSYHLEDALSITKECDFSSARGLADVGSGGGVPGIPLAIFYPDVPMHLIEVQQKKINFLTLAMQELGLSNGTVYPYDWRTFLRETSYPIDAICARASLQPEELLRMFKPASAYKEALLVYWAAIGWQPSEKEVPYIADTCRYHVGNKDRKFILFSGNGKPHQLARKGGSV